MCIPLCCSDPSVHRRLARRIALSALNVTSLGLICHSLIGISKTIPLIFPVHPRTYKNLKSCNLLSILEAAKLIKLDEPISYIPFMNLIFNASLVITDSGGLQEETTYLQIPCLTLRPNTERPVTISQGTNRLCTITDLESNVDEALNNAVNNGGAPEFWDGRTAVRVVDSIAQFLGV